MLFGQSVFQSVVTRLQEESDEVLEEEPVVGFRIHGLATGFVAETGDKTFTAGTSTEAYFDFLPEIRAFEPERPAPAPEPPPAPVIPKHLLRLTTEEIAEELAISQNDTEAMLNEKRRKFAKANHPDGVPEEFRDNATRRMQIANLLIDTAIKTLFWR
jgi:hypothetical protein